MAERPIFLPTANGRRLVREVPIQFTWNPGMSASQKKKNVRALHSAATTRGISKVLEISTKSDNELGQSLSAFALMTRIDGHETSVESAYQGSKVFEFGGPYNDLYAVDSRTAKKDERLRQSGNLIAFEFERERYPLRPITAFYDWVYINALYRHERYRTPLSEFDGFSDIEFNAERSVNCQARSCALFVALYKRDELDSALDSFGVFRDWLATSEPETSGSYRSVIA